MILYCVKLFFLLLSLLGYIFYIHKKGIQLSFCPIMAVSFLSLAMFLAGLLNVMAVTAAGLFAGGVYLFWRTVRERQFGLSKEHLYVGIFFIACYLFFAFRLRDTQVYWYDNFSHWAAIVRHMLKTNQLPNFTSYLIDFQSYPTGSSGFVYYICRILDGTEGSMLFGQFLITLGCLCSLFAFIKAPSVHSVCPLAVLLLGSAYLLVICVPITELCVDTLLSLLAISNFAMIVYYREDRPKAWLCTGILMTFLSLVKSSGLFFVFLHGLLLILMELQISREKKQPVKLKKLLLILVITVGIPLASFYLWSRHVSFSFYSGGMSKHSLSPGYLYSVFTSKVPDEILLIIQNFSVRLTAFEDEFAAVVAVPLVYILCILYKKLVRKEPVRQEAFLLGWSVFSYGCYQVGLLAMYLFAMPYEEAVELASFGRYILTLTSYLVGIAMICLLRQIQTCSGRKLFLQCTAAAMVLFLVFTSPVSVSRIFTGKNHSTDKSLFIHAKEDYGIPDESVCYITGEGEFTRLWATARYELWSGNLELGDGPTEEEYEDFIHTYEYLIVARESETIDRFLEAYSLPLDQKVYDLTALQ